jgi:thiol:disulfide interchange protein DsbD
MTNGSARLNPLVRRLPLAIAAGALLAFLPAILRLQGVGTPDLSARVGLSKGVGAGTFALLYLAGLLTSLTPCVYPLIPITVGVFGARKARTRARALALSAAYVTGIALTFSSLGVFAALSGKAFGSALSSPWVAGSAAILLFALAASMFGAFELDLPSGLKMTLASVSGAGLVPAFLMGLGAGVIAAPCTGPVLAGVLAFVAAKRSAVLGFWLLFSYAIGMGTLFFLLGTTSFKLPKSGAWLETVKSVLGLLLLVVGASFLVPLLPKAPAFAASPAALSVVAGVIGAGAVLAGALSLTFHRGTAPLKGLTLVALFAAIGLQLGWFGAARRPGIHWLHDEQAAVAQAKASGKGLFIDFYADWCGICQKLERTTFSDPEVQRQVEERFVPLKVDATNATPDVERLTTKYGVPGLPTVLMLACNDPAPDCDVPESGPGRMIGFEPPRGLLERIRRLQ